MRPGAAGLRPSTAVGNEDGPATAAAAATSLPAGGMPEEPILTVLRQKGGGWFRDGFSEGDGFRAILEAREPATET